MSSVIRAFGTFVTCYATSTDGIHWERPDLDVIAYEGSTANNLCAVDTGGLSVLKDDRESDPARRYKALYWGAGSTPREGAFERSWMGSSGGVWGICVAFSPDGIHWTGHPDNPGADRPINGLLSILIDPEAMAGSRALAADLERLVAYVTASPPATPGGKVLLPGEIERRTRAERLAGGIPLDPNTLNQLRGAARAVGLAQAAIERGITQAETPPGRRA